MAVPSPTNLIDRSLVSHHEEKRATGRFRYIAWVNCPCRVGAKRQRSAREIERQIECPYRVAGKASALSAGSDTEMPIMFRPNLRVVHLESLEADATVYRYTGTLRANSQRTTDQAREEEAASVCGYNSIV